VSAVLHYIERERERDGIYVFMSCGRKLDGRIFDEGIWDLFEYYVCIM
jgi:hypothetical protein